LALKDPILPLHIGKRYNVRGEKVLSPDIVSFLSSDAFVQMWRDGVMQESDNVFRTGKYHKSFGKRHTHLVRKVQLRVFYRTSSHLINKLGWPDPLAKEAPQILLCGTASPSTTVTFARFVKQHNSMASVDVLDISPYSLSQSESFLRTCQDLDQTKVSFVEGDALHTPFADERFDWIETDFFIQFFSPEEKVTLFQEWYRVLKPGGIITTRDWLQQRQNFIERVISRTKNWCIRHILGPTAYSASANEVKRILSEIGFEVAFFPLKVPVLTIGIPTMSYVVVYKPCRDEPDRV
jgi:SAM-dependent methyltransferase